MSLYALLNEEKVFYHSEVYDSLDEARSAADGLKDLHSQEWKIVELSEVNKAPKKSKGK